MGSIMVVVGKMMEEIRDFTGQVWTKEPCEGKARQGKCLIKVRQIKLGEDKEMQLKTRKGKERQIKERKLQEKWKEMQGKARKVQGGRK